MALGKIKIKIKTPTPTAAERFHAAQQKNRKAAGLPDPSEYKKKLDSMKTEQLEKKGRFVSGPVKQPFKSNTVVTPVKEAADEPITIVKKGTNIKKKISADTYNVFKHHGFRKEAADPREYDYEGDMAKSDLRSIIHNAQTLHDMLDDDTNLAEWCQSKITLAEDYISTVTNYMRSEMKEEVELDEAKKMEYDQKKVNHLKYIVDILEKEKKEFSRLKDSKEVMDAINKAINIFAKEYTKHLNALSAGRGQDTNFRVVEEVELDEMIRVKTNKPIGTRVADIGPGGKEYNVKTDKAWDDSKKKQPQGADFAAQRRKERLAKNGRMDEDAEQLDEISSGLKASYVAGAKKQIKQSVPFTKKGEEYRDIAKNFIAKREKGIARANESVQEPTEGEMKGKQGYSRKAQIVRDAAKGKKSDSPDKFQKDPELSSEIHKT